jgi:hypothetical protein
MSAGRGPARIVTLPSPSIWMQCGNTSVPTPKLFIDKNDIIYVADSESESVAKDHDGWKEAFGSIESVMVS